MAKGKQETKLDLVIGAIDRFSEPFRKLNEAIARNTQGFRKLGAAAGRLTQETGVSKLIAATRRLGKSVLGVGDGVAAVAQRFTRLGGMISAALGAAGGGLVALATHSANAGRDVDRLSARAGVSAEAFQRLAYAADSAGVDADGFASVLSDLGEKAVDAATGSKDLQEIFKALRINIRAADGNLKKSDQLLAEVADAFARMEDGSTKTAIALKLFSEEGARLIPVLNGGSNGLQALGDEAQKLGLVLDKQARKQSEDFVGSIDQLKATLKGLGFTIGQNLIPVLLPLIGRLRDWVMANRELVASRVREWVEKFAARLPELIRAGESVLSGLGDLFTWLGRVSDALGGADRLIAVLGAALSGPLLSALAGAASAFIALGAAIMTTPVGWFMAAVAGIAGGAYLIYKNWDGLSAGFKSLSLRVTRIFDDMWTGVKALVPDFGALWGRLTAAFSEGVDKLTGLLPDWLKDWMGIGSGKPVITVPEVVLNGAPAGIPAGVPGGAPVGVPVAAAGAAGTTTTQIERREVTHRFVLPEGSRVESNGDDDGVRFITYADLGYQGAW